MSRWMSAHFRVTRLPDRVAVHRFPNVDGHSTVSYGEDLYEIEQWGLCDIKPTDAGLNNTALADLYFESDPGVRDGTKTVTVNAGIFGTFENCWLVTPPIVEGVEGSTRIVRYRYVWRQKAKGGDSAYPRW